MNLYNAKQSLTSSIGEESPILKAVSSTAQAARTLDLPAALLLLHVVLHLTGRRDAEGRARNGARRRVDNGDRIAGTLGHGLVQLHAVLVANRRRVERIRGA
jgi:hypothetical protein